MIELRFHRDLYDGFALDSAVQVYGGVARFELVDEPSAFVVRLTSTSRHSDERIADEFRNYALGETIMKSGAAGAAGGTAQITAPK